MRATGPNDSPLATAFRSPCTPDSAGIRAATVITERHARTTATKMPYTRPNGTSVDEQTRMVSRFSRRCAGPALSAWPGSTEQRGLTVCGDHSL